MNTESLSAAEMLQAVIAVRNDLDATVEDFQETSEAVKNWTIERSSSDHWITYLSAIALTVMLSPFASEVYNYGWQELEAGLNTVEDDRR